MRITTQMIYNNFNAGLQANMEAIYNEDAQISSGQKLNKPSDNPADMYTIISGKAKLMAFQEYKDAISAANDLLNSADTALGSLNSLISSATQIGQNTITAATTDKTSYLSLMNNLIQSAISIANTNIGDRYIFSGYKTDQPAVNATTGVYQGTSDQISMEINSGTSINVNIPGNEFIAYGPVPSTNSNSGLLTATGSLTSPTAVYSTNGGSLAISLGGGPVTTVTIPASATLADVRDAINASGTGVRAEIINANLCGSPADYRIALSASPASPAADISVSVTTTDTAGTGLNLISSSAMTSIVSPDSTVIGTLNILKTAMEMGDDTAIQRSLTDLSTLSSTVLSAQSDIGTRLNRVKQESDFITSRDNDVTNEVSDKLMLSTADIARVTVDVQQRQTALESLRSITSGFLQKSLFDFLS
jgi:flagellar hook-associated protein 3 FlgL